MAYIYQELSSKVLGIAMQLHREMGCGFLDYKWYPNEWHHRTSASIGG